MVQGNDKFSYGMRFAVAISSLDIASYGLRRLAYDTRFDVALSQPSVFS
jgi:hypothetical protein